MKDECGYPAAIQKFRILISKTLPGFNLGRTGFQPLECLRPFMEKTNESDAFQTHLRIIFLTPG
jgi:hypothetical protein